jgi:hypothetical protein
MMEGSGAESVKIITEPYPVGPKIYGSGSGTLVLALNRSVPDLSSSLCPLYVFL